ncbi:retrotransposon nucleocapsid protein [Gigaspora margarita]|uniref:Retrotransposon nucleocapsid protein n=1 Tax=Gigaspora margarita TaxID=4874 RepID=A0A8H3XD70_GIGMA|nr:retrotransposon nucleocapsid protein [Gigaspora margarita]
MNEPHEYPFLSRDAFENLLAKYLDSKSVNRRRKTFITREDFDFCIKVLQTPTDTTTGTAKDYYWAKKLFTLRDLGTLANPIIQLIKLDSNLPVCPVDKIYEMLCSLHQEALKHVGSSKLWEAVYIENIIGYYAFL